MKEKMLNALYEFLVSLEKERNEERAMLVQISNKVDALLEKIDDLENKSSFDENYGVILNHLTDIQNILTARQQEETISIPVQTHEEPLPVEESPIPDEKISLSFPINEKKETQNEVVPSHQHLLFESKKEESVDNQTRPETVFDDKKNLRSAFSIGDKFLFQRELFNGSGELLQKTLTKIEKMNSIEEVSTYLEKHFQWDTSSEAYRLFNNVLTKWFSM